MKFIELSKSKMLALVFAIAVCISFLSACEKDRPETIAVFEEKELVGKKIKELTDLLSKSTFGLKKDMYPTTSRALIEEKIEALKKFLDDIKTEVIKPANVAAETKAILVAVNASQTTFLASKRTEDLVRNGLLHVNGKNGGYIDFGAHREFSDFDGGAFTVEFWSKVDQFGSFDFLLSTFLDNFQGGNDKIFQGWGVNYNGGNMRMTYAVGKTTIYEPPVSNYSTTYAGQWVHLAFVWNPTKANDGSGSPKNFKMYINGEPKKVEDWSGVYQPTTANLHMYGFTAGSFGGGALTDRGTNGYMRNMNIWKSLKTQAQIQAIKNNPTSVVGTEADLVCGWRLTQIALDNNDIPDITGRYSAKVVGDFNWIEL